MGTVPDASVGQRRERQGISCFIVCQDEEAQITECLESVRWCDEIVIVDGGSHDRTPELCKRYTDRFFHNPWPGYVGQKRFALEHTTQPWVLNVDADERVPPELRDEILELLRDPPKRVSGYYARRLVYYLGLWWHRGPFYPGYRLRLVRRSRASWGGTDPHDLAMVRGGTRKLKAPLLHYTYDDISDHIATVNRLTDVAAGASRSAPSLLSLMLRPTWRFAWTYTFTGGFREGFRGLFVCMTAAFYVFLRLAKRVERRMTSGNPDSADHPPATAGRDAGR